MKEVQLGIRFGRKKSRGFALDWKHTTPMTIDERIEAIVMSLELLTRDVQDLTRDRQDLTRDMQSLKIAAQQDGENIRDLARIAEIH